ncbi:MAG TPA: hypothetical protein VIW26_04780 [Gemmatimonadales bacterium]
MLRFQGASLTPDSGYFAAAPSLTVASAVHGARVRASIGPAGKQYCRSYAVAIQF